MPQSSGSFHNLGPFDIPGMPPARVVRVYRPIGRPDVVRPTLYLLDGQNVFEDDGSFAGGWWAHTAADRLVPGRKVVAPVVVGIPHGGERRISELSAWPVSGNTGDADRFLDWVVGSLAPALQRDAGLPPGAVNAVIGGSSMGGLAALYAHFRHPDVFGGALCMSPAFWVAGKAIFPYVAGRPTPEFSRIYLDCGAREGGGRMLPIVRAMARHLQARGYDADRLLYRADARGAHNELNWRRRLPGALRFMFRR